MSEVIEKVQTMEIKEDTVVVLTAKELVDQKTMHQAVKEVSKYLSDIFKRHVPVIVIDKFTAGAMSREEILEALGEVKSKDTGERISWPRDGTSTLLPFDSNKEKTIERDHD